MPGIRTDLPTLHDGPKTTGHIDLLAQPREHLGPATLDDSSLKVGSGFGVVPEGVDALPLPRKLFSNPGDNTAWPAHESKEAVPAASYAEPGKSAELEVMVEKLKGKLRKTRAELSGEQDNARQLQASLAAAKRELVAAEAQISTLTSSQGNVNEDLLQSVGTLTKRLEEARLEATEAKQRAVDELQHAHRQELLGMKAAFDELEDTMATLRVNLGSATQDLAQARRAEAAAKSHADRLEVENARLIAEVKARVRSSAGLPETGERGEEGASPELRKAQLELERANELLHMERATKQELAQRLAGVEDEFRQERRRLKGQLLQREDDALASTRAPAVLVAGGGLQGAEADLGRARAENKSLQSQLSLAESEQRRLQQEVAAGQADLRIANARLEDAKREAESYRHSAGAAGPVKEALVAENRALRAEMEVLRAGSVGAARGDSSASASSMATVRRLEKELSAAREQLADTEGRLEGFKANLTSATDANAKLRADFEEERQRSEQKHAADLAAAQRQAEEAGSADTSSLEAFRAECQRKLESVQASSDAARVAFERQLAELQEAHAKAIAAVEARQAEQATDSSPSATPEATDSPVSVRSSKARLLSLLREQERQVRVLAAEKAHALASQATVKEEAARQVARLQVNAGSDMQRARAAAEASTAAALSQLDALWKRRYEGVLEEARKARALERELQQALHDKERTETHAASLSSQLQEARALVERVTADAKEEVAREVRQAVADATRSAAQDRDDAVAEALAQSHAETQRMARSIDAKRGQADIPTIVATARAEAEQRASARVQAQLTAMQEERIRLLTSLDAKSQALHTLSAELRSAVASAAVEREKAVDMARAEERAHLAERIQHDVRKVLQEAEDARAALEQEFEDRIAAREAAVRAQLRAEADKRVQRAEETLKSVHAIALDALEARHQDQLHQASQTAKPAVDQDGKGAPTGDSNPSAVEALAEAEAREASLRVTLAHTREELRSTRTELRQELATARADHAATVQELQLQLRQAEALAGAEGSAGGSSVGDTDSAQAAKARQQAFEEARAHASKSIEAMRGQFQQQLADLKAAYDSTAARVMEDAENVVEVARQTAASDRQRLLQTVDAHSGPSAAAASVRAAAEAEALRGEIARLKGNLVEAKEREAAALRGAWDTEQSVKEEIAAREAAVRSSLEERLASSERRFGQRLQEARAAADQATERLREAQREVSATRSSLDGCKAQMEALQAEVGRLQQAAELAQAEAKASARARAEAERQEKQKTTQQLQQLEDSMAEKQREWEEERRRLQDANARDRAMLLQSAQEEGKMNEAQRRALQSQLVSEAEQRISELRDRYDAQIREMQSEHDAKLVGLMDKHTAASKALKREFEARLSEEVQAAVQDARQEMREAEQSRVAALEARVRRDMDEAAASAKAAQQAALQALEQEHQANLQKVRAGHEKELQDLTAEHEASMARAAQASAAIMEEAKQRQAAALDEVSRQVHVAEQEMKESLEAEKAVAVREAVSDALQRAAREAGGKHAEMARLLQEARDEATRLEKRVESDQLAFASQLKDAKQGQLRAQLDIERSRMETEDALAVIQRLDPAAVQARIAEAAAQAEAFLADGLESARAAMQAELDKRAADMQEHSRRQADTFSSQREEWVAEREALKAARDAAEQLARDAEAERAAALGSVEARMSQAADDAAFAKEQALKAARVKAEEDRAAHGQRIAAQKEKEAAAELKAAQDAWEQAKQEEILDLRQEYDARFQEFERESKNMQDEVVSTMASKHRDAMETAFSKALTDRENALKAVVEEKVKAIADAEARARAEVNAAREAATEILEKMKEEYATCLKDAEATWAQEKATAVEAAIEQAQSTAKDTMAETQAVWQRRLEEVVTAKEAEMLAAVMDIKAEATRLTEQHAQNMELLSMQGEDVRVKLLTQHAKELAQAIQSTLEAAEAEKAAALAAFNREWEKRLQEREQELEAQHQEAMASIRSQYADEMEAAMNEMEQQRLAALNAFMEETKAERAKMAAEMDRRIAEAVDKAEQAAQLRLESAMQQAEEERLASIEDTLQKAAIERAEAVEVVRRQAAEEQEEAMEELREESEKLLGSIEGAMNKLREERDLTEEECAELREQLEAQDELAFKLRKEIENLRKAGVLQGLKLVHVVAHDLKKFRDMVQRKDNERAQALERLEAEWAAKVESLEGQLQDEKDRVHELLLMQQSLFETLTAHKRELLLEHKVQSTVLQNELAEVYDRKQALQEKHENLQKGMGLMEGQIRQLEIEMQELSRQSILQDGKVNVALTRKKKRVDRDMDAMIIKVSEQKDKLTAAEAQMEAAEDERVEKEEELKYVEAQLVNTLIEQQRKLMGVLQSVSVDPRKYGLDYMQAMDSDSVFDAAAQAAPADSAPEAAPEAKVQEDDSDDGEVVSG